MEQFVHVSAGWTRAGATITNRSFRLIEQIKKDKDGLYITVESDGGKDLRAGRNRIYIEDVAKFESVDGDEVEDNIIRMSDVRTDEQIATQLGDTFEILEDMSRAVASNVVKGLVVSGPAGIGKSYTVEKTLQTTLTMLGRLNGKGQMYEVVSGGIGASMLFEKLWQYKEEGQVLVFDDCDGVLYDEDCLNLLKAALDSKKTRRISYNLRSLHLERRDIPNSFEYRGGIVFITNIKFDQVRSERLKNHLDAIVSRCHYMDLGIDTRREKVIHIRNVVERTDMLADYQFTDEEKSEVMDYVYNNVDQMRELSLRMVLKISDLRKAMPHSWEKVAAKNCLLKAA